MDQPEDFVSGRKSRDEPLLVFTHPALEVVGYADVQISRPAGSNVNPIRATHFAIPESISKSLTPVRQTRPRFVGAVVRDLFFQRRNRLRGAETSTVHHPHQKVHLGLQYRRLERFDLGVGEVGDKYLICRLLIPSDKSDHRKRLRHWHELVSSALHIGTVLDYP